MFAPHRSPFALKRRIAVTMIAAKVGNAEHARQHIGQNMAGSVKSNGTQLTEQKISVETIMYRTALNLYILVQCVVKSSSSEMPPQASYGKIPSVVVDYYYYCAVINSLYSCARFESWKY